MIVADVLFWLLILVGACVVLVAYWIGAHALFGARVERCAALYGERPVASTLLGLAIAIPSIVVATLAAKLVPHPVVQIPVVGALLVLALLALVGSAGLALRIGSGMRSSRDATDPWRRPMCGGIVLSLAFVMPFLGWFVLFPWTLASGLGALVLARAARRVAPSIAGERVDAIAEPSGAPLET